MNIRTQAAAASLVSLLIVSGCANRVENEQIINNHKQALDASVQRLSDRSSVRPGGAQFSDGVYVAAAPERHQAAVLLPGRLQQPGAVRLQSADPMTLGDISQRLTKITGVSHVVALGPTGKILTNDSNSALSAEEALANQQAEEALIAQLDEDSTGSNQRISLNRSRSRTTVSGQSVSGQSAQDDITMIPNLRGSLSSVLDEVASTFEVEWSYTDGRVLFRDYVTRKYQVTALPTVSTADTSIGANAMDASSSIESNVWQEVSDTVATLVDENATVSIGSTSGMITVTAKVSDQNRVEEYIEELNGSLGQQISFDVNVLTVSLENSNNYGLDIGAALNGTDVAADFGPEIFNAGALGGYNIGFISGDFSLGAIVQALSSQGQVSVATRAGTTTSNNRVAPIEVVDQTAYLKEVSIEEQDDGNDRISRTPDTVTTGFQMQLFPRVMNNREIMVQYTVRLSELNDIKTFGEGNDAVQLPEVSTTSFEQQAVLSNGQTLVLAGFERDRVTLDDQGGVDGQGSGFIGKSKASTRKRVATVMMITPHIISRAR